MNNCYKAHVTAVQFDSHCPRPPRRRPSATARSAGALAASGRTTSSEQFESRDTPRTPPSTSGATRRSATCAARRVGALPIGSPSPRSPMAGMASTSTTLIRVFKSLFEYVTSMERTHGHSSIERRRRYRADPETTQSAEERMTFCTTPGPFSRARWWLMLAAAFALPWVIAIGSHNAMAAWFPGQVKVDHWRHLTSASFLLGGVAAATLLLRLPGSLSARAFGGFFAIAGSLFLAFMFQLRSHCGDESVYVGSPAHVQVASCG